MATTNIVAGQVCDVFIAGELAVSGVVTTNNKLIEKAYAHQADIAEARDGNNAVFSVARSNRTKTLTVGLIYFNASTQTLAAARTIADSLPEHLAVATITGTGKTIQNGSYHVIGASLREQRDGTPAVMVLELKAYVENGTAGSLGAPVTLTLSGT